MPVGGDPWRRSTRREASDWTAGGLRPARGREAGSNMWALCREANVRAGRWWDVPRGEGTNRGKVRADRTRHGLRNSRERDQGMLAAGGKKLQKD